MPMPDKMGYEITGPDKATIIDALNTALNTLNAIKIVQLTPKERNAAQSASETRFPYIQNAIDNLAPQFPALQPGFLKLADAEKDFSSAVDLREINTLVKEVNDRFTDFALASEHFAYEYMRKFYAIAQEAQSTNTQGADTVVSELSPLFEGQGGGNPTPPTE